METLILLIFVALQFTFLCGTKRDSNPEKITPRCCGVVVVSGTPYGKMDYLPYDPSGKGPNLYFLEPMDSGGSGSGDGTGADGEGECCMLSRLSPGNQSFINAQTHSFPTAPRDNFNLQFINPAGATEQEKLTLAACQSARDSAIVTAIELAYWAEKGGNRRFNDYIESLRINIVRTIGLLLELEPDSSLGILLDQADGLIDYIYKISGAPAYLLREVGEKIRDDVVHLKQTQFHPQLLNDETAYIFHAKRDLRLDLSDRVEQDLVRLKNFVSTSGKLYKQLKKESIPLGHIDPKEFKLVGVFKDGSKIVYRYEILNLDQRIGRVFYHECAKRNYAVDIIIDDKGGVDPCVSFLDKVNDSQLIKPIKAEIEYKNYHLASGLAIDKNILKAMEEECNQKIEIFDENRSEQCSLRYQNRLNAINQTVKNGNKFDYSSKVQHPKFTDPYADVFDNCYGTHLERQLHEELCDTRVSMADLEKKYPNIMQVKIISPIVYQFTALAKEQTNPEIAFNLSDFCHHMTKVAQGFGNTSVVILKGVGKGTVNAVEDNITFCKSLATHPIDDIVKPLYRAGAALGKAVYCATELAINDPENFSKKTKELALAIGKYVYENPEDVIAGVVECLLPLKAPSLLKLKQVQAIIKAVQEQEKLAQAIRFAANVSTKITSPIKKVLTETGAVVEIGIQYGKNALQNVIKVAEEQLELTSVGNIAALKVPSECFNDFNKLSKEVKTYKAISEKGFEIFLPKVQTFEQARNEALNLVGDMGIGSEPYFGRLQASKGFEKIIGRVSSDRKVRWYLDYDPIKGIHVNVHDFRMGKGPNAKKYVIPFDGSEETFEALLKHLNK